MPLGEHGHVLCLLFAQVLDALVEDLFGVIAGDAIRAFLLLFSQTVVPDQGRAAAKNGEHRQERNDLEHAYTDEGKMKFWVITEADRSVTTILLPEEY